MPDYLSSPAIAVGAIAGGATTGAIIAMGHRAGSAGLPFAAISAVLFRRPASGGEAGLVFTGFVLHLVAVLLWSVVFVWLVERYLPRDVPAALLIGFGQFLLSGAVAWSSGEGLASVLPLGDRIVLAAILAAALVAGIRIALPRGADNVLRRSHPL